MIEDVKVHGTSKCQAFLSHLREHLLADRENQFNCICVNSETFPFEVWYKGRDIKIGTLPRDVCQQLIELMEEQTEVRVVGARVVGGYKEGYLFGLRLSIELVIKPVRRSRFGIVAEIAKEKQREK